MTQEDKKLLLQDLCARLPYGVKCTTKSSWNGIYTIEGYKDNRFFLDCPIYDEGDDEWMIEFIVPYLRPMSSMTKKETKELFKEIGFEFTCNTCGIPAHYTYEFAEQIKGIPTITNVEFIKVIDWLNAHHFDYRGLIERELAIVVTKENNPYENI